MIDTRGDDEASLLESVAHPTGSAEKIQENQSVRVFYGCLPGRLSFRSLQPWRQPYALTPARFQILTANDRMNRLIFCCQLDDSFCTWVTSQTIFVYRSVSCPV